MVHAIYHDGIWHAARFEGWPSGPDKRHTGFLAGQEEPIIRKWRWNAVDHGRGWACKARGLVARAPATMT
jgi:hypothetical protein